MNKKFMIVLAVLCVLVLLVPACAPKAEPAKEAAAEPAKAEATAEPVKAEAKPTDAPAAAEPAKVKSAFPLPDGAKIVTSTPEMVIASTNLKMADAIEFYRKDAKAKGFTEKDILTTITDNVFSIVFTRPNEEKELVIQGTVVAADNLTLSLRYEETDVK
jgi:outer membrane lipoprotein-sorting protein